jgi:hypothetical protein
MKTKTDDRVQALLALETLSRWLAKKQVKQHWKEMGRRLDIDPVELALVFAAPNQPFQTTRSCPSEGMTIGQMTTVYWAISAAARLMNGELERLEEELIRLLAKQE